MASKVTPSTPGAPSFCLAISYAARRVSILQTWTYRPQKRQDGSAFALTYILRLRSCKSMDILPSPYGCGLDPRGYSFSRPQCVHCCYGPVTRNPPWGGLVDRLRRFCFHLPRYPNYGALTSTPAGLSPAEHASLHWTHNRA